MKKSILAVACAAALAFPALASATFVGPIGPTDGIEGCAVVGYTDGDSCAYTPTTAGGVVSHGNISITLTFADPTVEPLTISNPSQQDCALWSPGATGGIYDNVVSVTITVLDFQSWGVIGDPFPDEAKAAGAGQTRCSS